MDQRRVVRTRGPERTYQICGQCTHFRPFNDFGLYLKGKGTSSMGFEKRRGIIIFSISRTSLWIQLKYLNLT